MRTETALTIAGSDSGGGAGIQADLKTFSALGVHGTSVLTSLTAQNTQGVEAILDSPPEFVGQQIDAVAKDFDIEWAKTGMVSRADIIRIIDEKTEEHGIKLVIDPVMIAASGSPLLEEEALEEMKEFLDGAELVTPNVVEAEELSGMEIKDLEDMRSAAEAIADLGARGVLIKGGHMGSSRVRNVLLEDDEFFEFEYPRVDVPEVHGTGCTFSAAITAELAKGADIPQAVGSAGDFMLSAVKGRLENGKGVEIVNPVANFWKVTGGGEEVEKVQEAARKISRSPEFTELIPEVGTNIAMALKGAEKPGEVVGLEGRIVEVGGKPRLTGVAVQGGSEHVASFLLTAMSQDPEIRAGMNIRFSEEIRDICREVGMATSSFDREQEPPEVRTMNWGTEKAIEEHGGVPDVVFDRGDVGKEAMIRLLGKTPISLVDKSLEIADKLRNE